MDNALSPIRESFLMWCEYHKRWTAEWWSVIKTGKTRDLLLSLCGSAVGPLFALSRGWIKRDHIGEILVVSLLGYIVLLFGTWLWHALFTASRIYAQQETRNLKSGELSEKLMRELENHLEARQQLVSVRGELIEANKKVQASSDAFHEQYAEINRLHGELAKWRDVDVKDTDPKVYAEFCDDRGATPNKESQVYIALINRGGADALNVCIDPIRVAGHLIKFPQLAYSISPNRSKFRYTDITTIENRSADYYHQDVFFLFWAEYQSLGDMTIPELVVPLTINYQDAARNLYEAKCDLVFDPSAHLRIRTGGQNGSIKVIQARDHQFTKRAIAVE